MVRKKYIHQSKDRRVTENRHRGQRRMNGTTYGTHPAAVQECPSPTQLSACSFPSRNICPPYRSRYVVEQSSKPWYPAKREFVRQIGKHERQACRDVDIHVAHVGYYSYGWFFPVGLVRVQVQQQERFVTRCCPVGDCGVNGPEGCRLDRE